MTTSTSSRGLVSVPLRSPLSAKYRDTFAFPTIKDRCPVILCKVIDHLHRQRNNIARDIGQEAGEGLYKIVEELSKLRYEMQTDKFITDILDKTGNAQVWNDYLERIKKSEANPSWFTSSWMWVECYMYRRVQQAVNLTGVKTLQGFDFFAHQKQEGFHGSLNSMKQLASWLLPQLSSISDTKSEEANLRDIWRILVQISLWGNKCDLSISAGSKAVATGDPVCALDTLKQFILSDASNECWSTLTSAAERSSVSLVMDNAGFELFSDLCLADFLITSKLVKQVRLRVKDQPWFVSDTTPADITWSLGELLSGDQDSPLARLGHRWQSFVTSSQWTVHSDSFWTYPHCYHEMASMDPDLYNDLSNDTLVVFKGDLNYRKLVGDLNWETTASFSEALQDFHPSNVLAIRTAKADVMVGLEAGLAETISSKDPTWMLTGQWGVIQFSQK